MGNFFVYDIATILVLMLPAPEGGAEDLAQLDDDEVHKALNMRKELISRMKNPYIENSSKIMVDGEPGLAYSVVSSSETTDQLLQSRLVEIVRNGRVYYFLFGAKQERFGSFSPQFVKILQNFKFTTPRNEKTSPRIPNKKSPAPVAPGETQS